MKNTLFQGLRIGESITVGFCVGQVANLPQNMRLIWQVGNLPHDSY